jgi:biotin operon repressor
MDVSGIRGGMTVQEVTGGLDLEAFMMSVSAERANNLENQMAGQINEIKQRQDEIRQLNQLMADLQALRPSGNDAGKYGKLGSSQAEAREMVDRLKAAGVTIDAGPRDGGAVKYDDGKTPGRIDEEGNKDAAGKGTYDASQITYDKWINEIKGSLDNLNSTSQMDMIRLQSLSNKRNQAFEMLTNQIQKFAKTNDSIIGNMR